MSVAIKLEHVSKVYRLGELGTGTISYDFQRWVARMRGKEDPLLKIGDVDHKRSKESGVIHSLEDLNFEINQGEAVGIIGRNGAGKSTLLKLLSQVTSPSSGKISIKGRIASLLEVGTGFHPDLTGKDNIYLNGSILGMRKKEIDSKLEEIINFSGVEKFIDTPVKRYSSGMYVRLAFAVAAHLQSEILIVDEVLAVGDAEFQKKCIGRMSEVSKGEGKTVLFVSHHMPSIKSLCNKAILLKNGRVDFKGPVTETIEKYFETNVKLGEFGDIPDNIQRHNTGEAKFTGIILLDSNNRATNELYLNEPLQFDLTLEVFQDIKDLLVDVQIRSLDGTTVTYSMNALDGAGYFSFNKGLHKVSLQLENNFQPGGYAVTIGIHNSTYGTATIDYVENILNFFVTKITKDDSAPDYTFNFVYGYIRPKSRWIKNQ